MLKLKKAFSPLKRDSPNQMCTAVLLSACKLKQKTTKATRWQPSVTWAAAPPL